MYFLDVNSRIPPIQAETVLTTPNDKLIGIPSTVNVVPIVEIPLITPTKLAPVQQMHVVIYDKQFYISVAFHNICS